MIQIYVLLSLCMFLYLSLSLTLPLCLSLTHISFLNYYFSNESAINIFSTLSYRGNSYKAPNFTSLSFNVKIMIQIYVLLSLCMCLSLSLTLPVCLSLTHISFLNYYFSNKSAINIFSILSYQGNSYKAPNLYIAFF